MIHITGTNGKGSTAQMVTRLLMAQGLQVGTYTSPHLERINERLARDAEPISDEELAEQIAAIADLEGLTGVRPTYFEACTAAAFRWFADTAVDVAVVEVGLLGRWDATNVVNAQVAVVTNIGMDHNEFAGPTLADIAREKSGIIKPTGAAVIGETDPDIVAVLAEAAGRGPPAARHRLRDGRQHARRRRPAGRHPHADDDLPRRVRAAARRPPGRQRLARPDRRRGVLRRPAGARTSSTEGFANVTMPGRFEVLGYQPLVVIDGAHNPAGADTCAQVFFDDFNPEGRRILVVGTLREPTAMLEALRADEFDVVVACTAPSPRGIPVADVARAAVALGCDEVLAADSVEAACALAMHGADGDDAVLAAGSLYVAGAARPALKTLLPYRSGRDPPDRSGRDLRRSGADRRPEGGAPSARRCGGSARPPSGAVDDRRGT